MFNFSRKDTEFFELFWENAKYFHLGAIILDEIIKDPNKTVERKDEILALEASSDNVNEKIISKFYIVTFGYYFFLDRVHQFVYDILHMAVNAKVPQPRAFLVCRD